MRIDLYIRRMGSFDLVIGGSTCNHLARSNHHYQDSLEGEHTNYCTVNLGSLTL
jgi:hypothetical protein